MNTGNVGRIDLAKRSGRKNANAAHRLDRIACEANRLDAILSIAAQFRDGVTGLPVGEAFDDEQVNGFVGHE